MLVTDGLKERVTFGVWFDALVYDSPELSEEAKAAKRRIRIHEDYQRCSFWRIFDGDHQTRHESDRRR